MKRSAALRGGAMLVAALAVVCVVSCGQAESPARARAECASDATCMLGDWTADCCPRCKPFSAPTSEVLALDRKCRAMSSPEARCPELKCPPHEGPDYAAKCADGRCVVTP